MTDPYDDIPIEGRREAHGWFGVPWWSFVCFDEAGKLIEEMRKAFPVGESCVLCGEEFNEAAGDSGQAIWATTTEGTSIRHVHAECQFMNVAGPLAHHDKHCHCYDGDGNESPSWTRAGNRRSWRWTGASGGVATGRLASSRR